MKNLFISGLLLLTLAISSCSSGNNSDKNKEMVDNAEVVQQPVSSLDPAFILRTNCYLCHNPKAESHDNILGPPLVASKFRYFKEFSEREDFVKGMTSFIMNPQKESALMVNPVKKFGVMPATILSEEQVMAAVEYIYDNKVEEPSWFSAHYQEEHGEPWLGQGALNRMNLVEKITE